MKQGQHILQRTSYALSTTIHTSPWASAWSRLYRQVFWLADGQRTTERIAVLLHKPVDGIEHVAEVLTINGYLSMHLERKVLVMNVLLLKRSFHMIVPRKEEFARSFYERLFTDYPETRALFAHTNMRRQESSLMGTLAAVVAGVERGENMVPTLYSLGERHSKYGAVAEHYPLVGAVLLETFHKYLGNYFTIEMQDAWSQAFNLISEQMIEGTSVLSTGHHFQ